MESMIDEVLSGKAVLCCNDKEEYDLVSEILVCFNIVVLDWYKNTVVIYNCVRIVGNILYHAGEDYYRTKNYQIYQAIDFILVYNASKVLKEISE